MSPNRRNFERSVFLIVLLSNQRKICILILLHVGKRLIKTRVLSFFSCFVGKTSDKNSKWLVFKHETLWIDVTESLTNITFSFFDNISVVVDRFVRS